MNSQGLSASPRRNALELEYDSDPPLLFLSLLPTVRAFCKKNKALSLKRDFSLMYNTPADSTANTVPQDLVPPAFPESVGWILLPHCRKLHLDKIYPLGQEYTLLAPVTTQGVSPSVQ